SSVTPPLSSVAHHQHHHAFPTRRSSDLLTFPKTERTQSEVKLHGMDGGIKPARPDELEPDEIMGDGNSGILFVGTKGKMMASEYAANPRLIPVSRTAEMQVPQRYARVKDGAAGHYAHWVECGVA